MASPEPTEIFGVMAGLFASGHAADLVLACLLAEGMLLAVLALRRGSSCLPILANVASGAFLVLAFRAALLREAWPAMALPLLLALVSHGVELAFRFRAPRPAEPGRA